MRFAFFGSPDRNPVMLPLLPGGLDRISFIEPAFVSRHQKRIERFALPAELIAEIEGDRDQIPLLLIIFRLERLVTMKWSFPSSGSS